MIILGLDISTSNVGYALVSSEPLQGHRLLKADSINVHEKEGLYEKSKMVRDVFLDVMRDYRVDVIVVEESLMSFGKRRSSAATLAVLNRFNGIISFIARDTFGVPIAFVNSIVARKKAGLKIDKESGIDTKEQIFFWVKNHSLMRDFEWPTKIMKSGTRKGETVFEKKCYDISDAVVTALWACDNLNIDGASETIC